MIKKYSFLALLLACFSFFTASSQDEKGKYDLLFLSGTITPDGNISSLDEKMFKENERTDDKLYRIIQFNEIPTNSVKAQLKNAGIELLTYVPNNAYFAALKSNVDVALMRSADFNIRSVLAVDPKFKVHPLLDNGFVPDWAENVKGKADLIISFFESIPAETILRKLNQAGIAIDVLERDELNFSMRIRVDKHSIAQLSTVSFISYVESIEPPYELENSSGTTLHRSNTINTLFAGGPKYDGTGVVVAVGDGGYIASHPDLRNRLTTSGTAADHATHVAGIIAGAGNIDPLTKGQAPGATIISKNGHSDLTGMSDLYTNKKVRVSNHSLGEACNDGYTANARTMDLQAATYPNLFNVFSAGNSGSTDCGYGAGAVWGNITGGYKAGKNAIAMGNLSRTDAIASSSSRGPSKDGRIKPDICAKGSSVYSLAPGDGYANMSGTSMASPGGAGCFSQLIHAYRDLNSGNDPKLGLLKGVAMNTADDLGNIGPDYIYGWGRINVLKAYNLLKEKRYASGSIENSATKTHTITVPADVKEIKVMVYWTDPAAASGVAKALVNDLDITLTDASNKVYEPWLLSFSASAAELSKAAVKGKDRRNNMEQVSVENPPAGTYTLNVNGYAVPTGPQEYFVTYEFIKDEIVVTYPYGGESFVPGENEYIRWDAAEKSGTFKIEYSSDNGSTWQVLSSSVAGNLRYFVWTVPTIVTGNAIVRVSRNGISGKSQLPFSIIKVPTNVKIDWRCETYLQMSWAAVAGATSYEVYLLGDKYMESQGTTTSLKYFVNLKPANITWVSVKALADNGKVIGRRAIAIKIPAVFDCVPLSVDDNTMQQAISVYPNPTPGVFEAKLNVIQNGQVKINVYNLLGECVYTDDSESTGTFTKTIDISSLPASAYMLYIKAGQQEYHQKIIKN
jgi:hypothetical protein